MKSSTRYEARLEVEFQNNPDGHAVILADGQEVIVKSHEDTPRGRRLRCRGIRRWVHLSEVEALRYFRISINPDWRPGGKYGPPFGVRGD